MFVQLLSSIELQLNFRDMNIAILSQLDDIQVIMDDHYVKTLAMRGSAFVKPCEGKAQYLREAPLLWIHVKVRLNNREALLL